MHEAIVVAKLPLHGLDDRDVRPLLRQRHEAEVAGGAGQSPRRDLVATVTYGCPSPGISASMTSPTSMTLLSLAYMGPARSRFLHNHARSGSGTRPVQ